MIPYARQNLSEDDIYFVSEALQKDFLTTGPLVELFESKLSEYVGAKTFAVNSGTAALHAAYFGGGIGEGDEVVTPPNTFIATQAMLSAVGAEVKFADIDLETGLISLEEILSVISPKTKAIVLVDYAGQTVDIDTFKQVLDNQDILLIEDAAHSLGTTYKGSKVGSLADITTFSFFATKNITTGEGGAVASKFDHILEKAKVFARQGLVRTPENFMMPPDGPWHQEVQEFGFNYRLTDFQSALGISQLKRLGLFKAERSKIFERYESNLAGISGIELLRRTPGCDPMWHLVPIRVRSDVRKDLYMFLKNNGFGVQVNYFPSHCHPVFARKGYKPEDFPNALRFYKEEISLPIYVGLEMAKVDEICEQIATFMKTRS